MIWDKVFWLWYGFIAIYLVYELLFEMNGDIVFSALLFAGLGLAKLAQESSARKGLSRKLLERLRK